MSGIPPTIGVVERRRYTLHPGRRDELVELFERVFVEPQEAAGIVVLGTFCEVDHPDVFTWFRGFADMQSRRRALESFYGGPVWAIHRDAANATMIDSDDVHLLRPIGTVGAPAVSHHAGTDRRFAVLTAGVDAGDQITTGGWWPVMSLTTLSAVNDFPALPVRTDRVNVVVIATDDEGLAWPDGAPTTEVLRLAPTSRSRWR